MLDLHTHHHRCGHASGTIEQFIQAAIECGLRVIGISDHAPYFASEQDHLHPDTAMAKSEFPRYVEEVLLLKERYKDRIEVLLGIESDYFPEHEALYKDVYAKFPMDYVIGSVHHSGGAPIFRDSRWNGQTEADIFREKETFLRNVQASARSGLFDVLGHIDALKRNQPLYGSLTTAETERTMRVIADCDVAIELNSSGAFQRCEEWYPSVEMLELAVHYRVPITFGSDAHQPAQVARDYERVAKFLRELGFRQWALFRQRKRYLIDL